MKLVTQLLVDFSKALIFIVSNVRRVTLAVVFILLFSIVIVVLSNIALIGSLAGSTFSAVDRLIILFQLLLGMYSESGPLAGILMCTLVALFSIEITLIVEYIQHIRLVLSSRISKMNLFSMLASVFGFGCVACGSLLSLVPVFTSFSVALLALPFKGLEFVMLGIVALVVSIGLLYRRVAQIMDNSKHNQ